MNGSSGPGQKGESCYRRLKAARDPLLSRHPRRAARQSVSPGSGTRSGVSMSKTHASAKRWEPALLVDVRVTRCHLPAVSGRSNRQCWEGVGVDTVGRTRADIDEHRNEDASHAHFRGFEFPCLSRGTCLCMCTFARRRGCLECLHVCTYICTEASSKCSVEPPSMYVRTVHMYVHMGRRGRTPCIVDSPSHTMGPLRRDGCGESRTEILSARFVSRVAGLGPGSCLRKELGAATSMYLQQQTPTAHGVMLRFDMTEKARRLEATCHLAWAGRDG